MKACGDKESLERLECCHDLYLANALNEPGASVVVSVGDVARQGGVSDDHVLPAQILHVETERSG